MKAGVKLEIPPEKLPEEPYEFLRKRVANTCGISPADLLSFRILKRSVDARKKPSVKFLYSVLAEIRDGAVPANPVQPAPPEAELWRVPEHKQNTLQQPFVVGAGPAGLFAAYVLALAGCRPVVFERGDDVDRRREAIETFFRTRRVNPESNLLFGEGGAGTWSDGKLFTRVRDPRCDFVMRAFTECGAEESILWHAHPHIGSDRLPGIIAALRNRIIELGGEFHWGKRVTGIRTNNGAFRQLVFSDGSCEEAPAALIASGHSARDLILSLTDSGAAFRMKPFQTGCRIEHPQEFINEMQYGLRTPCPALGAAEYLMSSRPGGRTAGATTFCMCPGGEIIPAVCDPGRLSTNGMSNAARSGAFANAAVITGIPEDVFKSPRDAFNFLDSLESDVYEAGGGEYTAPAQTAENFIFRRAGSLPLKTSYRFGLVQYRLDRLLPRPVSEALSAALRHFDRMSPGFVRNGVLIGMETHVSSPVRFERNPETLESSIRNLYLGGEGGGMAGGIVSAAVDGVRLAEAMLLKA